MIQGIARALRDTAKVARGRIRIVMATAIFCAPGALAVAADGPVGASTEQANMAANDVSAPSARGTRLILLGTGGGPVARRFRSQPASLLIIDGHAILIDAGDGTIRQIASLNLGPSAVETIFLTHLHFDHTAGLASVIAFNWVNRAPTPISVYGPPGTQDIVAKGIDYLAIPSAIYAAELSPRTPMNDLAKAHDIDGDLRHPKLVFVNSFVRVTVRKQPLCNDAHARSELWPRQILFLPLRHCRSIDRVYRGHRTERSRD